MPDKGQFTFDDDDGFPETDLGGQENLPMPDLPADEDSAETDLTASFLDGEHEAVTPLQEEPEIKVKEGGSIMRIALLVVLLVVIGGAGVYYFMDLGGTTSFAPTPQVPAQKAKKSVALPPQPTKVPAKTPVAPAKTREEAKPVTVVVPPPPAEPVAKAVAEKSADKGTPVKQPEVVVKPKSIKQTGTQIVSPAPKSQLAVEKMVVEAPPAPKPVNLPEQVVAKQVSGSAYALDAGSYLLKSNRKALVTKIKKLGYEPLITSVDATLDMTRLRLGTFSKDEVQEALAFARTIEPGSYSAPAGEQYVIYAGTFLNSNVADKLTQRLLSEGVKVYPEPVQVMRTLSRIRFGSFATKEDAAAAVREVGETGLKAVVVKSRSL